MGGLTADNPNAGAISVRIELVGVDIRRHRQSVVQIGAYQLIHRSRRPKHRWVAGDPIQTGYKGRTRDISLL